MGVSLFVLLHILVMMVWPWALLLTVPLHLLYGAAHMIASSDLHASCSECGEIIPKEDLHCGHCGGKRYPAEELEVRPDAQAWRRSASSPAGG